MSVAPKSMAPRLLGAIMATGAVGAWATMVTVNDDWDDYLHTPVSKIKTDENKPNERIVILGTGWGGLNALRKCVGPDKDVVVVSPRPHFLYTPLLAGSAVGTIALRSACEPIRALVAQASKESASATYVRADARFVDHKNKRVYATEDGEMDLEFSYDKLLVAVGAQPNTFGIPGVKEYGYFLKEAEDSARLHAKLLSNLERASSLMGLGAPEKYAHEIERLLNVVVVGGGPTGVELAAELADFKAKEVRELFGEEISSRLQITLVEALPRILGPFDEGLADVARQHLVDHGVEVRTGFAVTKVDEKSATLAPSTPRSATPQQKAAALAKAQTEPVGALIWAAGIGPRPLVQKLANALGQADQRGLKVDSCLRVEGADGVYAIGDAALDGLAPTAQVASQEGKHVGRAFRDGEDRPFVYKHAGSLCSLGQGNGIAQLVAPNGNTALNIWDVIGAPAVGPNKDQRAVTGAPAFAMWRSLYWSKLLSNTSRVSLSMDWIKAQLTGREVVEPVLKRKATIQSPSSPSSALDDRTVECYGTPLRRNPTLASINLSLDKVEEKKPKRFGLF